jgi:hypothetical protein
MEERAKLDLNQFFSPAFFIYQEKTDSPQVEFTLPTDASTLADFLSSDPGIIFKAHCTDLINKLAVWTVNHNVASANEICQEFINNYINYLGNDKGINELIVPLYRQGIPCLSGILHLLQEEKIPLEFRKDVIMNLFAGMTVCIPGINTNLYKAHLKLVSQLDSGTYWMALRKEFAEQHIKLNCLKGLSYHSGNEIHYVNALVNRFADLLGIQMIEDEFIKLCDGNILDEAISRFTAAIATVLTPINLIDYILEAELPLNQLAEQCNLVVAQASSTKMKALALEEQISLFEDKINKFGYEKHKLFYAADILVPDSETYSSFHLSWHSKSLLRASLYQRLCGNGYLNIKLQRNNVNNVGDVYIVADYPLEFSYVYCPHNQARPHHSFISYLLETLLYSSDYHFEKYIITLNKKYGDQILYVIFNYLNSVHYRHQEDEEEKNRQLNSLFGFFYRYPLGCSWDMIRTQLPLININDLDTSILVNIYNKFFSWFVTLQNAKFESLFTFLNELKGKSKSAFINSITYDGLLKYCKNSTSLSQMKNYLEDKGSDFFNFALNLAITSQDSLLLKDLFQAGAALELDQAKEDSQLAKAVSFEDCTILAILSREYDKIQPNLSEKIDLYQNLLRKAIASCNLDMVNFFLETLKIPPAYDMLIASIATHHKSNRIYLALMSKFTIAPSHTEYLNLILQNAIQYKKVKIIHHLLINYHIILPSTVDKAILNKLLVKAICNNNIELAEQVISHGADLNLPPTSYGLKRSPYGKGTLLHLAIGSVYLPSIELLNLLITSGTSVNKSCPIYGTPLCFHLSRANSNDELDYSTHHLITQLLLNKGANIISDESKAINFSEEYLNNIIDSITRYLTSVEYSQQGKKEKRHQLNLLFPFICSYVSDDINRTKEKPPIFNLSDLNIDNLIFLYYECFNTADDDFKILCTFLDDLKEKTRLLFMENIPTQNLIAHCKNSSELSKLLSYLPNHQYLIVKPLLQAAVKLDDTNLLTILFDTGISITVDQDNLDFLLFKAVRFGSLDVLKLLCNKYDSIERENKNRDELYQKMLVIAISNNQDLVIDYLVNFKKIRPTFPMLLESITSVSHQTCFKLLDKMNNENSLNALMAGAIRYRRISIIYRLLMNYGTEITSCNDKFILNALLIKAVSNSRVELAEYVIHSGADVNLQPGDYKSSVKHFVSLLHIAICSLSSQRKQMIKLLVKQGANLNSSCQVTGCTPLHFHLTFGIKHNWLNQWINQKHYSTTLYLLKEGADPNQLDYSERTALDVFLEYYIKFQSKMSKENIFDKEKTIETLLSHKASADNYYTSLSMASKLKNSRLEALLLTHDQAGNYQFNDTKHVAIAMGYILSGRWSHSVFYNFIMQPNFVTNLIYILMKIRSASLPDRPLDVQFANLINKILATTRNPETPSEVSNICSDILTKTVPSDLLGLSSLFTISIYLLRGIKQSDSMLSIFDNFSGLTLIEYVIVLYAENWDFNVEQAKFIFHEAYNTLHNLAKRTNKPKQTNVISRFRTKFGFFNSNDLLDNSVTIQETNISLTYENEIHSSKNMIPE